MNPGDYAANTIASIQNDESGNPAWIVSGHWKASLTEGKPGEYGNQTSLLSNSTLAMGQDMPNKVAKSGASIDMVRLMVLHCIIQHSTLHQHKIDNFTFTEMSMPDNTTMIYNGTVTVTMREGPVHDVPISAVVLEGSVINLCLE